MTTTPRSTPTLTALEQLLGYQFADPNLLRLALTHRSASRDNYERLEFLGDSIVNHVIAEALFHRFPEASEGQLSRLRASLVSGEHLAKVALTLDLPSVLILGIGERKSGGRKRASILADAFEAILGAIFLDGGLDETKRVVLTIFRDALADSSLDMTKDAKTQLQEWLQGRGFDLPQYSVQGVSGDDHEQEFTVRAEVPALALSTEAKGRSRRKAEQLAARKLLKSLES